MSIDYSYADIAAAYDKSLMEYKSLLHTQKELDKQLERAEFILNEIRQYLENPITYKMKISNNEL